MSSFFATVLTKIISVGDETSLDRPGLHYERADGLDPDISIDDILRLQHLQGFRLSRRTRGVSGSHWATTCWERRTLLRRNPK